MTKMPIVRRGAVVALGAILCALVCNRCGNPRDKTASIPAEVSSLSTPLNEAAPSKPNVVWIVLDACRAQNLSCYGYHRPTSPHLDRLAARGVLFEANYAQGFATFVSLPSYFTGRYFALHYLASDRDMPDPSFESPPEEALLPTIFSQNGYRTLLATAHFFLGPRSRLWRAFHDAVEVKSDATAHAYFPARFKRLNEAAIALLEKNKDRPFFLYMHAMDTHFPLAPAPPYDKWLDRSYRGIARTFMPGVTPAPPQGFTQEDRAYFQGLYDGAICESDAQIGELLDYLSQNGLEENTIVIVTSDHGEALAEDGHSIGHGIMCEEVMHTPFIMAGPGIPQGVRIRALTENVDIAPTLIAMIGLSTTAQFDGQDVRPLFSNPAMEALPNRSFVFARSPGWQAGHPTFVLRTFQNAYFYDTRTGVETLFDAPFALASLHPVHDAAATDRLRSLMMADIMPKWNAYDALLTQYTSATFHVRLDPHNPYVSEGPFLLRPGAIRAAVDPALEPFLPPAWIWFGGAVLGIPDLSDPLPPLRVRLEIPNGTYRVFVECMAFSGPAPMRASAFFVQAQQDAHPQRIVCDDAPGEFRQVEIGTYTVLNGAFHVVFEEAAKTHAAFIGQLLFTPIASDASREESPQERKQREEQMRALGYQW